MYKFFFFILISYFITIITSNSFAQEESEKEALNQNNTKASLVEENHSTASVLSLDDKTNDISSTDSSQADIAKEAKNRASSSPAGNDESQPIDSKNHTGEKETALSLLENKLLAQEQELAAKEAQLNAQSQALEAKQSELQAQQNKQNDELISQRQQLLAEQEALKKQYQQFESASLNFKQEKQANEKAIKEQTLTIQNEQQQLAFAQFQLEQKEQQIEEHWINKTIVFLKNNFSGALGLSWGLVGFLLLLPILAILQNQRRLRRQSLIAIENKDYVPNISGQHRRQSDASTQNIALPASDSNSRSDETQGAKEIIVNGKKIIDRRAGHGKTNLVSNKPFIWLAVIIIPVVLFYYLTQLGVAKDVAIYSAIVSITLVMWMSSLLPEFVPALIALLLVLLFGLAPNDIVLSGFSSPGFLLLFSVMGLGAVITGSGLTRRYTLWLVKSIPSNLFANQIAVFFTGLIFNPVVPTINGRAMIVAPILHNIVMGWKPKTRKQASTPLYTAGLDGINFLSPIFLTAAPANLMIYGLLPAQEQQAFEFMFWIYAASIVGLVMLVLYFVMSAIFFHSFQRVEVSRETVEKQYRELGPMRWGEWIALVGIILMAIGIATSSVHKVSIPLITFAVLCAVLAIGVLSRDQFIKHIDWSFLVLLASMIGILATMNHLGIDKTLVSQFSWLGDYMRNDFSMFVLMLTGMILIVRIFIPLNSAILIFAAALLPLASGAGVSTWVVGLIILLMCGTAFFGYQSPYILYFRSLLKGDVPYVDWKYQVFQLLLVGVKLAAIYASIPFWTRIGVL